MLRPEANIHDRYLSHAFWFLSLTAVAALCATTASAQEEPDPGRWQVSAELSFTDQSGNKVLRLFTGGLKVSHREKEAFELEGSLQSRYGMSDDEVVARNHYASLAFDLHPKHRWSPFLFVDAERDPFKRLDLRLKGGAGAKYTPYASQTEQGEVSVSLALLYSLEDVTPSAAQPAPPARDLARWSLRVRGKQELRPGITAAHVTFFQPAWDQMADYLLRSETETKVLLTERLALSVGYQLNRTARPPEGVEPDDRLLKTGLIIHF